MKYRITTPAAGYTGDRAGVHFVDGAAEVDGEMQSAALAFFRSHGYGVEPLKRRGASGGKAKDGDGEKTDPGDGGHNPETPDPEKKTGGS